MNSNDLVHLRRCVALATEALEKGDEPFGSVLVVGNGQVRWEGHNEISCGRAY